MANEYLKSLTIGGATQDIHFTEYMVDSKTFNIAAADAAYGGASVSVKKGYTYLLVASCIFGTSTSTASQSYQVWIANQNTPLNPFVGDQNLYNMYSSAPRVIAVTLLTPVTDAVMCAYANIRKTILGSNTITLQAFNLGRLGGNP